MSVARGSQNAGHYYSNIVMPYRVDLQFTVNAADSGGLGITGLKSNGWVRNVFMHTSTTAGVGNDSVTNPNPASGIALIQLKQNFNAYLGCYASIASPVTGAALTSVTVNVTYVIVTVGTTTTAQWVTAGLPVGLTPTAGQVFVAAGTASLGGTGTVKVQGISGVGSIEVIGDPNQSLNNSSIAVNGGAYVFLQFLGATSSSVTTQIPVAPATSSVVSLGLLWDRSSVTVDGL